MKKLLIGLVAAMCCFVLAAPAFAQLKISGMITLDAFYFRQDAERYSPVGGLPNLPGQDREDRSTTRIGLPQALNRLDVQWTSEDKKVHGRIQLRYGAASNNGFGGNNQPQGVQTAAPAQTFDPEFAYIDYHWTPGWYTRFGRQEQTFAIMAPSQGLGQMNGHIVGANWGNVHGGTARDGIKNYFKFSDMVRLEVALFDPMNDTNDGVAAGFPIAKVGGANAAVQENSVIPRIDAALNIKIANFVIEPSVTWLRQEYEGVWSFADDKFDIWGAAVGVSAGFGPIKISSEVTYGQNLGAANYVGGGAGGLGSPFIVLDGAGAITGEIEDTDVLAAWIDAGFNFGPFEIHGIVGYEKFENDGNSALANNNFEREVWMYGFNMPIKMTKNFTIKPEIMFYADDDAAETRRADGLKTDFGSEMIAGVQFMLVF